MAEVPYGPIVVREPAAVYAYRGETEHEHLTILFFTEAMHPVYAALVFPGELLLETGPFSGSINTAVPLIPSLPGGPNVSVVQLQSTFGPAHLLYEREAHGELVTYRPRGVIVPRVCAAGGYPFAADFAFEDGSHITAHTTAPCPPHARRRAGLAHSTALHFLTQSRRRSLGRSPAHEGSGSVRPARSSASSSALRSPGTRVGGRSTTPGTFRRGCPDARSVLPDYSRQARTYDRTRAASPLVLAPLRSALAGAPGLRLADLGGGTGNYALVLQQDGWDPVVIDRSPEMLARASSKGLATMTADAQCLSSLADCATSSSRTSIPLGSSTQMLPLEAASHARHECSA